MERFSFRQLIRGTVYYENKKIYSFTEIGYNSVKRVIEELVKHLPADIPKGCWAKFKIENLDKGDFQIYDRQKGKGF